MTKKILVLSNMYPSAKDRSYGRFVQICVEGLIAEGCDVKVVGISKQFGVFAKLLAYLRFGVMANLQLMLGKFDCIYVHHPLHTLLAAFPGLLLHRKIALNFHGHDLIPVTRRGAWLQRLVSGFFTRAAIVIVPSKHFKRVFQSRYHRPVGAEPKVFYSGGVGEPYFQTAPVPILNRKPSALFLSRLVVEKGWMEFLSIATRLEKIHQDMDFTIAGVGPDAARIRAEIERAGIGHRVKFVESSTISSNLELYDRHRYFIFPTRFDESLALVNLEAMARGCVVFSSDFPTSFEYIDQGGNGYRFSPVEFQENVCAEISRLETHLARTASVSDRARKDVLRFRESVIMKRLPVVLELQ